MADERELRVERRTLALLDRGNPEGVWLECDGERCGDFEPWMVRRLRQEAQHLRIRDMGGAVEQVEAIANAISRILKEAKAGD